MGGEPASCMINDMAHIRIFTTQDRTEHCVKAKLRDK